MPVKVSQLNIFYSVAPGFKVLDAVKSWFAKQCNSKWA